MRNALLVTLIGVFIFTLTSGYAVAIANAAYIREGTSHGVKYMTGGVGINERSAMDRMAKGYDLKLVFAEPSRPYLASVKVEIQDNRGEKLIETNSGGPWFFAKLPDGQYTVTATHAGKKEVRRLEVGQNLQTVMGTSAAKAKTQPVKTEAKKVEGSKGLQTLTFYWKA